jgi:hypothetical protein
MQACRLALMFATAGPERSHTGVKVNSPTLRSKKDVCGFSDEVINLAKSNQLR